MLHANMMPLLPQVYKGRLGTSESALDEFGGRKVEVGVVGGNGGGGGGEGLKIASVEQRDLEYDPRLYQRDRGELDWDAKSIVSQAYPSNPGDPRSGMMSPPPLPNKYPAGYEEYMAGGPGGGMGGGGTPDVIEMSRMDTDALPLLSAPLYYHEETGDSMTNLQEYRDHPPPPPLSQGAGLGYGRPGTSRTSTGLSGGRDYGYPPRPPSVTPQQSYSQSPPQTQYPSHSTSPRQPPSQQPQYMQTPPVPRHRDSGGGVREAPLQRYGGPPPGGHPPPGAMPGHIPGPGEIVNVQALTGGGARPPRPPAQRQGTGSSMGDFAGRGNGGYRRQ